MDISYEMLADLIADKVAEKLQAPEYYTRSELADMMKCTPATITAYVKDMESRGYTGIIRSAHFLRVSRESWERYMKEAR